MDVLDRNYDRSLEPLKTSALIAVSRELLNPSPNPNPNEFLKDIVRFVLQAALTFNSELTNAEDEGDDEEQDFDPEPYMQTNTDEDFTLRAPLVYNPRRLMHVFLKELAQAAAATHAHIHKDTHTHTPKDTSAQDLVEPTPSIFDIALDKSMTILLDLEIPLATKTYNIILRQYNNEEAWNELLHWYSRFVRRRPLDVFTHKMALIAAYKLDDANKALDVFQHMRRYRIPLNSFIADHLIAVLSRSSEYWDICRNLYDEMLRSDVTPSVFTFKSLINACAVGGDYEGLAFTLSEIQDKSAGSRDMASDENDVAAVAPYTYAIARLAKYLHPRLAVRVLTELMPLHGVTPDLNTYNLALRACCKTSWWSKALEIFREMCHLRSHMNKPRYISNPNPNPNPSLTLKTDPVETAIEESSLDEITRLVEQLEVESENLETIDPADDLGLGLGLGLPEDSNEPQDQIGDWNPKGSSWATGGAPAIPDSVTYNILMQVLGDGEQEDLLDAVYCDGIQHGVLEALVPRYRAPTWVAIDLHGHTKHSALAAMRLLLHDMLKLKSFPGGYVHDPRCALAIITGYGKATGKSVLQTYVPQQLDRMFRPRLQCVADPLNRGRFFITAKSLKNWFAVHRKLGTHRTLPDHFKPGDKDSWLQ